MDPGDAYWQMFFEVFESQITSRINNVTSSDRSVPGFPATQHWTRWRVRPSAKKGA
jgi:hypothetical protein